MARGSNHVPNTTALGRLTPISNKATASNIAEQVRELVADGSFEPGAQITEVALANALRVSRGPVREALQRLVQEGLLENERNRGIFVPRLTIEDIQDIYRTRSAIELCAMEIIMGTDNEDYLDRADEKLGLLETAMTSGEYKLVSQLDLEFHMDLIRETRSKRLMRAFDTLIVETRMCLRSLEYTYEHQGDVVQVHRRMLAAVRDSDIHEAKEAINEHNATVMRDLPVSKA